LIRNDNIVDNFKEAMANKSSKFQKFIFEICSKNSDLILKMQRSLAARLCHMSMFDQVCWREL